MPGVRKGSQGRRFKEWGRVPGKEVMGVALIDRPVNLRHIDSIPRNVCGMRDRQILLRAGPGRHGTEDGS